MGAFIRQIGVLVNLRATSLHKSSNITVSDISPELHGTLLTFCGTEMCILISHSFKLYYLIKVYIDGLPHLLFQMFNNLTAFLPSYSNEMVSTTSRNIR